MIFVIFVISTTSFSQVLHFEFFKINSFRPFLRLTSYTPLPSKLTDSLAQASRFESLESSARKKTKLLMENQDYQLFFKNYFFFLKLTFIIMLHFISHGQLGRSAGDIYVIFVMFRVEKIVVGVMLDYERDQRNCNLR